MPAGLKSGSKKLKTLGALNAAWPTSRFRSQMRNFPDVARMLNARATVTNRIIGSRAFP